MISRNWSASWIRPAPGKAEQKKGGEIPGGAVWPRFSFCTLPRSGVGCRFVAYLRVSWRVLSWSGAALCMLSQLRARARVRGRARGLSLCFPFWGSSTGLRRPAPKESYTRSRRKFCRAAPYPQAAPLVPTDTRQRSGPLRRSVWLCKAFFLGLCLCPLHPGNAAPGPGSAAVFAFRLHYGEKRRTLSPGKPSAAPFTGLLTVGQPLRGGLLGSCVPICHALNKRLW